MNREQLKKQTFEENAMGKRLRFVRESLGLKILDIVNATGIPRATYADLEQGARSKYYEELLRLASFLDDKWQQSHSEKSPKYQGRTVPQVHLHWLMFGVDPFESLRKEIAKQRIHFFKREYLLINQLRSKKNDL